MLNALLNKFIRAGIAVRAFAVFSPRRARDGTKGVTRWLAVICLPDCAVQAGNRGLWGHTVSNPVFPHLATCESPGNLFMGCPEMVFMTGSSLLSS